MTLKFGFETIDIQLRIKNNGLKCKGLNNKKKIQNLGNYSCLRVDLQFTRDRAFYFTTVFIPGIILVTSSFITFWLEWNAVPARAMIGNIKHYCCCINTASSAAKSIYRCACCLIIIDILTNDSLIDEFSKINRFKICMI